MAVIEVAVATICATIAGILVLVPASSPVKSTSLMQCDQV